VSYDKFFCSKVLKALADQQRAPNSLLPSLSQWAALVNICSGAVLGSRFPQLVEVYSRLTQSCGDAGRQLQEPTSADALAMALSELSKVSSGTVRSITFIGGVDCGWLAALAQWLLSLRVDILAVDGSVLYSSRTSANPADYPQVIIVLQSDQDAQVNTLLWKKSVAIPPGDSFFNVRKEKFNGQSHSFSAGRSEWSTVLNDAFGADFDLLLHQEIIQGFAVFLCRGFSVSDPDDNGRRIDPWGGPSTTSSERQLSYLSFAAKRLPELIPVFHIAKKMISCQEISLDIQTDFPSVFKRYCSCALCNSAHDRSFSLTTEMTKTSNTICLRRVALTIFEYIWTLSWLDIDEDIYPSANGLVILSGNQETYNDETTNAIKKRLFERPLMPIIILLFTGQLKISSYSDSTVSARSKGGVCVYLPPLKTPNSSPQEQLRVIVVAGHIEWNSKIFSRVIDGGKKGSLTLPNTLPSTLAQAYGTHVELKLVVEETFDSEILIADLWISRIPTEPSQGISYHAGHIDRLSSIIYSDYSVGHCFGVTKIRSAILKLILISSSNCHSRTVELQALSIDGLVSWHGPCCKAAESLWVDGHNNKCYSPTSNEWVLISQSPCCQEIVRGPYQLLYSVICNISARSRIFLGSASCLMCLLRKHRQFEKPETPLNVVQGPPSMAIDLGLVAVHSFLNVKPSSRVLITAAIFPPLSQNLQSPSVSDRTIYEVDQEPNSGVQTRATPHPASQTSQSPSEEADHINSEDEKESNPSVSLSQAINARMPRPELDFDASELSKRPRARSL
jgi:hypothetical protein